MYYSLSYCKCGEPAVWQVNSGRAIYDFCEDCAEGVRGHLNRRARLAKERRATKPLRFSDPCIHGGEMIEIPIHSG